jgi:PAS domain S-box-containing protein
MPSIPDSEKPVVVHPGDPSSLLRQRALDSAVRLNTSYSIPADHEEARALLEELRIHQIELEMQNEELQRLQAELELSRLRYFDLYDLAPAGYITVAVDGTILESNLRAATLFGSVRSTLVGRSFTRHIAGDSQQSYHLARQRQLLTNEMQMCELRMLRGDAPAFWARLQLTLADELGHRVCRIMIVDISDLKSLEEDLRAANAQSRLEKDRAEAATLAKSQFLSSMSHEIRTPLNGVIGMAGLLMQTGLSEEQLGYARIVSDSAEALLGLVNNILDFSKIEAGQLELEKASFDLEQVISNVLDITSFKAQEKSIELACWYPAHAPTRFLGDMGRIRQVLMNLISNSIKFTNSGYVLVEVHIANSTLGKCNVKIVIHDSGIGISQENLSQLFARFRQADPTIARLYGGTGLGLSIVKQIVELLGGEVGVSSKEGEGSSFTCRIPLPLDKEQPQASNDISCLTGLTVLVSGSTHLSRSVIPEWCRRWEMLAEYCAPDQLPRRLQKSRDEGRPFRVVIIDAVSPVLLEAVQSFHAHCGTPVPKLVLVTSHAFRQPPPVLTADAVLTAPLRSDVLAAKLTALVLGSAGTPSLDSPVPPALPSDSGQHKVRVLVTDDNIVNQKLACALLVKLGCEVDTADDGAQAVRKVAAGEYDLVLMDCVMPVMDGFDATVAIRKLAGKSAHVRIVALTASATTADRDHCLAVGMNDYLTKPIRSEQLSECLAKWITFG